MKLAILLALVLASCQTTPLLSNSASLVAAKGAYVGADMYIVARQTYDAHRHDPGVTQADRDRAVGLLTTILDCRNGVQNCTGILIVLDRARQAGDATTTTAEIAAAWNAGREVLALVHSGAQLPAEPTS